MRAGFLNKWVTLSRCPQTSPDMTGFFEDLSPPGTWAAIQPGPPGAADTRSVQHLVTIRYHAQVNFDTRILWQGRSLFVRGVQNVNEDNVEMRLLCEEVFA